MEKRFRSLHVIGTVFKVLAWISLVFGILGGLLMCVASITGLAGGMEYRGGMMPTIPGWGGLFGGLLGGFLMVAGAVLNFLFLYAAGDAIYLALAIEENTREAAYYLKGGDNLAQRV